MKEIEIKNILEKLINKEMTYDDALHKLLILYGIISKETDVKYSTMKKVIKNNNNWKKKGSLYYHWIYGYKNINEAYIIITSNQKLKS